jgi:hypothetical protein
MNMQTDTRTLEELEARRDVLEEEIASIKAKIDNVRARRHATGEWADPDWYRRATTRQRFLGVEHQRITRLIAARKREQRAAQMASIERAFVGAAKSLLGAETFDRIMSAARAEVARG